MEAWGSPETSGCSSTVDDRVGSMKFAEREFWWLAGTTTNNCQPLLKPIGSGACVCADYSHYASTMHLT
jgi:hypothetical protein